MEDFVFHGYLYAFFFENLLFDCPFVVTFTWSNLVSELYLKLGEVLENRHVEVHLDINPDDRYGSSCVISQAVGYIKGTCNVTPSVKPNAFAASYAADRFKGLSTASYRARVNERF